MITCKECPYWREKAVPYFDGEQERCGRCMANPPVIIHTGKKHDNYGRFRSNIYHNIWPQTSPDDFCQIPNQPKSLSIFKQEENKKVGRKIMTKPTGSQTEAMFRLIKDGKIVGYQYQGYGNVKHHKDLVSSKYCVSMKDDNFYYIPHDSFDPGIKVGDKWWFAGDEGIDDFGNEFMLIYDLSKVRWCIDYPDGDTYFSENMTDRLYTAKRLGNIYESEGK